MTGTLRCYSFHSVKGGVGKSTLSILCAHELARGGKLPVTLLDMDLTGTSLADVMPLEAPAWEGIGPAEPLNLLSPRRPDYFHSRQASRSLLEQRREPDRDARHPVGVPFLNDFLLYATQDWDEAQDVPVNALQWRMEGGPEALRIIPSSALPADLARIMPVIFDEERAAYLEARLEYLLEGLIPEAGEAAVVVDTPPTIPGLSRSVLSLALRLSGRHKQPLSRDGGMPARLERARIEWTAFIVATPDVQDLRAAERWLSLFSDEEREVVRFLVNRVPPSDGQERQKLLEDALRGDDPLTQSADPLVYNPIWFEESAALQLFRTERVPPTLAPELSRALLEGL